MQNYLLTFLLNADTKDEERQALVDSITKKVAKVQKEDLWGVRSLAYPIKKQDRAYYVHLELESEPQTIPSLDKSLKLNEDILRYLLVKVTSSKKQVSKRKEANKKDQMEENQAGPDDSAVDSTATV